ncbi:MAG: NAD(+) diphosphatase [Actinomycetota bacterium]|nr:NAD(+) diphosphatase [Actinomycetota bacterium]
MHEDPPLLARASFDRAAHRRAEPAWLNEAFKRARVLLLTPKSAAAATHEGTRGLAFRLGASLPEDAPRRFLGVVGDVAYFTSTTEPSSAEPGADWLTLRDLGRTLDDLQAGLFTTAVALEQWHQRHTHCPLCGTPTKETNAGWTRTCPDDGSEHFPRTDPAVIMLIHDGRGNALLGRGQRWEPGRFSTLAGFVEPGESLEAAVAREVFEEVGVRIEDIRYVASQPWPFPSSLMLGFSASLLGDPEIHLDPVEMAEAAWFTRAEVQQAADWVDSGGAPHAGARLAGISPKLSISRYLINRWLAGELP